MALDTGRYCSSLEIIRNCIRDTGTNDSSINWQDAIEWTAECLDLIGTPYQLMDNIACIPIDNHRGDLPCDFHQVTQVSGLTMGNRQFPMRETTNSFHPVFTCKSSNATSQSWNGAVDNDGGLIDSNTPIGYDINGNPTFNFMNDQNVTLSKFLAGNGGYVGEKHDSTYKINDSFIFTSFSGKFDKILMAYKAFPIDEKGFPLIPDDTKFKIAVKCYLTMKLDYILWRRNDITKDIYEHSEREWCWYVGAAGNKARIPTYDHMESIMKNVMRLVPNLNMHNTNFRNLGTSEKLIFGKKYI